MPTYPLTFPASPKFASFEVRRRSRTPVTESPFDMQQQVQEFAHRWEWTAQLPPMKNGDANIPVWLHFLNNLHGRFGTFSLDIQGFTQIDYLDGFGVAWATSQSITKGQHRTADTGPVKLYIATTTGTTGVTEPTGTGTGINDGGVTWDYVEDYTAPPTLWRSADDLHGWTIDRQRFFSGLILRAVEVIS